MTATEWFLEAAERGNPATDLDRRHPNGDAWTSGNRVETLVHGATYFAALVAAVRLMRSGDLLLFTDWRGDPDERLDADGTEVADLLSGAAAAGVTVRGLVWRSHLDRFLFSEQENQHLGAEINAAGGACLLDMRVRPGGSHHQKFVVLRHLGRPQLDCAFVGGIDLCHGRRDDATHAGDVQHPQMSPAYGPTPPWHDVQLLIRGPAVGDVETVFRERWDDPAVLSRNPLHYLRDKMKGAHPKHHPLPAQYPDPAPCGTAAVQVLRTYPSRRPGYPFAPLGERSVARGITKAVKSARHLIYLEDQYLWSREIAAGFAAALRSQPDLRLIAVIPSHPEREGRISTQANLIGRVEALKLLLEAGGDRVAIYGLENHDSTAVYVHAKVCIVDDTWSTVGSDNINRRSWTHDSELSCAVVEDDHHVARSDVRPHALVLRLTLAREHLDRPEGGDDDLVDAKSAFGAFADAADALDRWHATGRRGERPPGRLRRYSTPQVSDMARGWAQLIYRTIFDPDGRPRPMRASGEF